MSEADRDTEELPKVGKHRARDQWGPREIIAVIVVVGAFGLAFVGLITDHLEHTVPAWTVALVGGVGIYYYRNGKEQ